MLIRNGAMSAFEQVSAQKRTISFDVNAYKDNSEIAVTLLTGSVSILSTSSNKVLANMKPNQKAIISLYDKDECNLTACNAEEEAIWRLGKLKIDGEELADMVKKMERWYGVKIVANIRKNIGFKELQLPVFYHQYHSLGQCVIPGRIILLLQAGTEECGKCLIESCFERSHKCFN